MPKITAYFESAADTPLTSPANAPTIRIRREDTQALVATDQTMTEIGEGLYRYDFAEDATLEYTFRCDGDPTASGQTVAGGRYASGSFSGITEDAIETKIPNIETIVSNITSVGGGAVLFPAEDDNTVGGAINGVSFVGTVDSGTFASTESEDGVYHTISGTATAFDVVYQLNIGGSRIGTSLDFRGYLNGNNDEMGIQVYDHVGAAWDTLVTVSGQAGGTNVQELLPILQKHTGTGVDLGLIWVRFIATAQTSPILNVDLLLAAAVASTTSIGYQEGAVWIDTNASNTNTENFVDGVANNPVSTIAAARTIADQLNIKKFRLQPTSSVTLAQEFDGYEFAGFEYDVDLNGQSVSGAGFQGATIIGNDDGTNTAATVYQECSMGTNTLGLHRLEGCGLGGTITLAEIGTFDWVRCHSQVAGTGTPAIDFGTAVGNTNVNMRSYSGGIQVEAMGDTGTDAMSLEGFGQLIEGTCTAGVVAMRGNFTISEITNLTLSDNARFDTLLIDNDVYVDIQNGVAGTDQYLGRFNSPVNNMADAITIAETRAARTFRFVGELSSFTLASSEIVDLNALGGVNMITESVRSADFSSTGAPHTLGNCFWFGPWNINLTNVGIYLLGRLDGCFRVVFDSANFIDQVDILDSRIEGTLRRQAVFSRNVRFIDCFTSDAATMTVEGPTASLDWNLSFIRFGGTILARDFDKAGVGTDAEFGLLGGIVDVDSSNTSPVWIRVTGIGQITGSEALNVDDARAEITVSQQDVRDAMKLAPTVGAPIAGSVDEHLDDILADTAAIEPLVSTNLDATVSSRNSVVPMTAALSQTEHDATQAAIAAQNDFDPAVDVVANVTLVDTTTTNTDMRGTDGANTVVPLGAATDQAEHDATQAAIAAQNDFDPAVDVVANVTLVDTTTTNTDMRGTDGANTVVPLGAATDQAEHDATQADIAALNDLNQAGVQAAMTAQGYTSARAVLLDNLDATISSVVSAIGGLNDPTASAVAVAVWDSLRSAHTTSGSMGNSFKLLLDGMISRKLIDITTNPWQRVDYVFDEVAGNDTVVADRYDLYDQNGSAISGTPPAGNNPLADSTILIAEERRV